MTKPENAGLILHNAVWVTPDGLLERGSMEVVGGRLQLNPGEPDCCAAGDVRVLDAAQCLVLPGIIDSHTHLRQPGQKYKEGIDNGTAAALKGGVTCVLDMPNNRPPCTTAARLERKRAAFQRHCRTHWGLHLQTTQKGALGPRSGFVGAKVYMAKSSVLDPVLQVDRLSRLFAHHRVVIVHAEDEGAFDLEQGLHHEARPTLAVESALDKVERAYRSVPGNRRSRLVLAHVGTAQEILWVRKMKAEGFDVWAETCPHYCLYTDEDYVRVGSQLQVNPPLRSDEDRVAVLAGLRDGTVDFLSTDHAPHTAEEKASSNPPSGIPSIEWFGPIAFSLVERGLIDWKRYMELTCSNASACFGIAHRDGLKDGNFADLFVLGPAAGAGPESIVTRADYNPYDGYPFSNLVHATVVQGQVGYQNGSFTDCAGQEVGS